MFLAELLELLVQRSAAVGRNGIRTESFLLWWGAHRSSCILRHRSDLIKAVSMLFSKS